MTTIFKQRVGDSEHPMTDITEEQYNTIIAGWCEKYRGFRFCPDSDGDYSIMDENGKHVAGFYRVETPRRINIVYYESSDGHTMDYKIVKTTYKDN